MRLSGASRLSGQIKSALWYYNDHSVIVVILPSPRLLSGYLYLVSETLTDTYIYHPLFNPRFQILEPFVKSVFWTGFWRAGSAGKSICLQRHIVCNSTPWYMTPPSGLHGCKLN